MNKNIGNSFVKGIWETGKAFREYNSAKDLVLLLLAAGSFLLTSICENTYASFVLVQIYQALGTGEAAVLYRSCLLCTGVLVLYFLLTFYNNVYGDYTWVRIWLVCVRGGCRKLHRQPFDRLGKKFGKEELVNRVDAGSMDFPSVLNRLITIIANTASIFVLFGLFSSFSWALAIAAAILVLWGLAGSRLRVRIQKKFETKRQTAEDHCGGTLREAVYEIAFSSMYACRDRLQSRYQTAREASWSISWRQTRWGLLLDALSSLITSSLRGFVGYSMFPSFRNGRMQTEDVTSSFSVYDKLSGVVNSYASPFVDIQLREVRIERMNELFSDEKEYWSEGSGRREQSLLEAEHIYYEMGEKEILQDVSLSIDRGEKIALIGHNGCGKSTLLRVLAGLYEPRDGGIRRDALRMPDHRAVSYIPSRVQLYEDTVETNIRMNGDGNLEEIVAAAGLQEEGEGFLEQIAGTLSGGQAQRVNVARGLIHDASILLADEPESGLPPTQGDEIIKTLLAAADIAVIITHYPEHLKYFSRIVLMEEGKIAVAGSLSEVSTHPAYIRWRGEAE